MTDHVTDGDSAHDHGHEAVEHGDHLDHVRDGHRHASHHGHWDER